MKRFKFLILAFLLLIIFTGFSGIYFLGTLNQRVTHEYRVEVNEILSILQKSEDIAQFDLTNYKSIQKMEFLSVQEKEKKLIENFYHEENDKKIFITPFFQNDSLVGYLKFYCEIESFPIEDFRVFFTVSLFILFLLFVAFLYYFYIHFMKPLKQMKSYTTELSKGHFTTQLSIPKNSYYKNLLWGINELRDHLITSKKMELVLLEEKKKMIISLSHDIKTPLNVIQLYTSAFKEEIYQNKKDYHLALKQMDDKIAEINQYVEEIVKNTKEDFLYLPVVMGEFYLKDLIQKIKSIYQPIFHLRHFPFVISPFQNKLLNGDYNRAQEVMENIIENALKYGNGETFKIFVTEEEDCTLIHFYNSGDTVLANEFNHLFDSFFRGSNSKGKKGIGLGLFISRELMRKMDGNIYAEIKSNGMEFVLIFR